MAEGLLVTFCDKDHALKCMGITTVKAFYFVGQKFRRLKTTDIFVGT